MRRVRDPYASAVVRLSSHRVTAGRRLAVGYGWQFPSWGGIVVIWDLESGCVVRATKEQMNEVQAISFAPDGRHLIFASGGSAQLLDVDAKRIVRAFAHTDLVDDVDVSRKGMLATACFDGTAAVWDVASGK